MLAQLRRFSVLAALLVCWLACPPALGQDEMQPEDEPDAVVEPPDTRAGLQLKWVLSVINGQPIGDVAQRFTPRFMETFSAGEITKVLTTLRGEAFAGKEVVLIRLDEATTQDSLSGIIRGKGMDRFLAVFLAIDEQTGKIAGLQFNAAGYTCSAGDWNSFGGEMGRLVGGSSFGAYELVPKDAKEPKGKLELVPVYEYGWDKRLNIAGAVQLFVLEGVAERLRSGRSKWEDPITITDEHRSMPGSPTGDAPAGSTVSVRDAAARMIAQADTTATDHLMALLGRDDMEKGFAEVVRTTRPTFPLLFTRELFALK